jgi:hypothetical protein
VTLFGSFSEVAENGSYAIPSLRDQKQQGRDANENQRPAQVGGRRK